MNVDEQMDIVNLATPGPWVASSDMVEDLHFGPMRATKLDTADTNLFAVSALPFVDAVFMAQARTGYPLALAVVAAAETLRDMERADGHSDLSLVPGAMRDLLAALHAFRVAR